MFGSGNRAVILSVKTAVISGKVFDRSCDPFVTLWATIATGPQRQLRQNFSHLFDMSKRQRKPSAKAKEADREDPVEIEDEQTPT